MNADQPRLPLVRAELNVYPLVKNQQGRTVGRATSLQVDLSKGLVTQVIGDQGIVAGDTHQGEGRFAVPADDLWFDQNLACYTLSDDVELS